MKLSAAPEAGRDSNGRPYHLMLDLTFSLLEGGLPQEGRVVVFFRFVTPARVVRSGMLNFDRTERRFVGPQRSPQLMDAALDFIAQVEAGSGRPHEQTA